MKAIKAVTPDEFFRKVYDTPEETRVLLDHLRKRQVISALMALRALHDVTQAGLAAARGCTQSAVSKLEAGVDADLTLADLEAYARATNSQMNVVISHRGMSLADQIQWHARSIQDAFLKVVELAQADDVVARSVAEAHLEAFSQVNRMLADISAKLSPCSHDDEPHLRVTMPGNAASATPIEPHIRPAPRKPRSRKQAKPLGPVTSGTRPQ